MEILTPEPVAGELNIELSDSGEENEKDTKSKQKEQLYKCTNINISFEINVSNIAT